MNISTSNTLLGFALPAIPWEEQPAGSHYGAADTVTGLAFGYVDEILAYLKDNSKV